MPKIKLSFGTISIILHNIGMYVGTTRKVTKWKRHRNPINSTNTMTYTMYCPIYLSDEYKNLFVIKLCSLYLFSDTKIIAIQQ